MRYNRIKKGHFLSRPNRFTANVEMNGKTEICHVKNTGRCRELLIPGADVFLEEASNPNRKTKYDLVQVYKGKTLVNMDSQMPNALVEEWLKRESFFRGLQSFREKRNMAIPGSICMQNIRGRKHLSR